MNKKTCIECSGMLVEKIMRKGYSRHKNDKGWWTFEPQCSITPLPSGQNAEDYWDKKLFQNN